MDAQVVRYEKEKEREREREKARERESAHQSLALGTGHPNGLVELVLQATRTRHDNVVVATSTPLASRFVRRNEAAKLNHQDIPKSVKGRCNVREAFPLPPPPDIATPWMLSCGN